MRFLVLAHRGDETALRVYAMLQARHGPDHVKLVSGEELALSPYWVHRLEDGRVTTDLRLQDGTVIGSESIGVVFNRLLTITVPYFASATDADRNYAASEMYALCLSWLTSLPCPVVNAATPMSLSTQPRGHAEWLLLADKAGLPIQGFHFSSNPRWFHEKAYLPYRWRPVSGDFAFERISMPSVSREPTFYLETLSEQQEYALVANPKVVGRLSGLYDEQLKRLASISACDLLQVTFARAAASEAGHSVDENWKVCGVNPFPHIQTADALSAIVQLLEFKLTAPK